MIVEPGFKINTPDLEVTTTTDVLFYESSNGSVAVLSRIAKSCSDPHCSYIQTTNLSYAYNDRNHSWIDNTLASQQVCGSPGDPYRPQCNTPFTSCKYTGGSSFGVVTYFWGEKDSVPEFYGILYSAEENSEDANITQFSKYR